MTIRVVLSGREGLPLEPPPGRVVLVHADHSFADLAEAIDTSFGRWDLAPLHEFGVEGRRLAAEPDPEQVELEDSDEVTVGEVGLRPGSRFSYLFDLEMRWVHDCTVSDVGVDPFELLGDEPELPAPVFGWGAVPDQYGRDSEDEEADEADLWAGDAGALAVDEDDELADLPAIDLEAEFAAWDEAEAASWEVVEKALQGIERPVPADELSAVVARIRAEAAAPEFPFDVLMAAGGFAPGELDPVGAPLPDDRLWLELASGIVGPRDETPLDPEQEAAWLTLELADWAGAVIGLVRGGVGQSAEPRDLIGLIETCPEIDLEETDPDSDAILEAGLETVVTLWEALGAVDRERRLTVLGLWGLPAALRVAWTE
jgi:hypothetical protein